MDSLGRAHGSPRATLWQLFYFLEAVPLWQAIARLRVRHVHAHFTAPAADVAMIVAQLGDAGGAWSWSFSAHGADIAETDQRMLAEKLRRAALVVCISDFGRSQLMTLLEREQWDKLRVVRCGLDPRAFVPRGRGSDGEEAERPLRLLAVGRLVAVKGHAILLDAVARASRAGLQLELTLVGDGPLRVALEQAAERLAIARRVHFAGAVGQDEIADFYRRADVFCLPSLREGVPVVLMEAMACGIPVVATRINGIPELVEDHVNGLLVAPGRADAITAAIARLAADAGLRERLGRAARARVVADYDADRNAAELAALFGELVTGA